MTKPFKFLTKPSRLTFFRMRVGAVGRLYRVVDHNRRGVAQPERPRADNFVSRIQSGSDRHLIALTAFYLDYLLANPAVALARLLIFNVGDHEYGIAVRCVVDGGCRQ